MSERDWAQIRNALAFYADELNWHDDDWGVRSVLTGGKRGEGYGRPYVKAKMALMALKRIERGVKP